MIFLQNIQAFYHFIKRKDPQSIITDLCSCCDLFVKMFGNFGIFYRLLAFDEDFYREKLFLLLIGLP